MATATPARLSPPPPRIIAEAMGLSKVSVEWLAGDGSDRCYFRVRSPETTKSFVVMQLSGADLEHLKAGSYDWVEISGLLDSCGVLVPKPVVTIKDFGALIIDDYGDEMLETRALQCYRKGNLSEVLPYYTSCLDTLAKLVGIRAAGPATWTKRCFDEERFVWELDFFVKKYLEGVCQRALNSKETQLFQADSRSLARFLAAGSKYFVHRDFHSRNVMLAGTKTAVIDFQDARLGPISYDLVSLCFDSYVPFSSSERLALLERGIAGFLETHGSAAADEVHNQWRPMLLQRQLKALGSFGYLTVDKMKGDYLKNVSPALTTLLEANLFDSRWPFLSGELLNILQATLPTGLDSKAWKEPR